VRTLVVEDSQSIRGLLQSVLVERGHHVIAVESAELGLREHERAPFDLLLVDLVLPGMDGHELVKRVRHGRDGDRPVIVAFTGQQSHDMLVRLLETGIDDFLTKPLSPEELSRRLLIAEAHVREGRMRRRTQFSLAVRVAHELNNPLSAVMANLQLIAERIAELGEEAVELRELVTDATGGAERMKNIVRELLARDPEDERDTQSPPSIDPHDALRVLVVDDEALVAQSLKRILRGHDIVVANRGADAVEILREGAPFDVVLCDLMMPDVDGMEVFRRVQDLRPEAANRFVFMTGGAFSPGAQRFLAEVPNERLEKPFELKRVRSVVQAVGRGSSR